MFLQTVGQRDYVFYCLGARGDGCPLEQQKCEAEGLC